MYLECANSFEPPFGGAFLVYQRINPHKFTSVETGAVETGAV